MELSLHNVTDIITSKTTDGNGYSHTTVTIVGMTESITLSLFSDEGTAPSRKGETKDKDHSDLVWEAVIRNRKEVN